MAASGNQYSNNFDHYGSPMFRGEGPMSSVPASVVIPNEPQPTTTKDPKGYQHHTRTMTPSTARYPNADNNSYLTSGPHTQDRGPVGKGIHTSQISALQTRRPPSRTEQLKRRSSLREAARSLGSSKVAQRLRRHIGSGTDADEDANEAPSTPESDHSYTSSYVSQPAHIPSEQPPRSQSVVSDLMNDLQSSLAITPGGNSRGSLSSASISSRTVDSSDAASTNTSFTSASVRSKRNRSIDDNEFELDDEEFSDRTNKRPCSVHSLEPEQPQLFACPFAKHDSRRYSAANLDELHYRGCSQSYLTDLARVKQHLYRVHERPPHHCPTCYEVFKNQAQCIKHVAMQSCFASPCPFNEKMTPEQLAAIKKKNRGTDPYLGWYEIYKTLFPGSSLPMSPYAAFTATVDTLESFMEFVSHELPKRLRHQTRFVSPTSESIQGLLPDILRDIRRDFNPTPQHKPESMSRSMVESSATNDDDTDPALNYNFHHAVTVNSSNHNQVRYGRTPLMDISPSTVYLYPPTSSGQILANSIPLQLPFGSQNMQQNIGISYSNQPMSYDLHNENLVSGMSNGPPTAIWQPEIRDSSSGYFADDHQTQIPLPGYLTQMDDEGNWVPAVVTTRMHPPMTHAGVQDMMNGLFPGGFANQQA